MPAPLLSLFGLARCTRATETAGPISSAEKALMVQPSNNDDSAALDQRMVRALDHPVRAAYLKLLAARDSLSPAAALPLLGQEGLALSNVVYHVRVLDYFELVEPTGEPEPNGGVAFRTTPRGQTALAALGLSSQDG